MYDFFAGDIVPGDHFKIILLEEDPVDAELIERSLRQASAQFSVRLVSSVSDSLRDAANSDLLLFSLSRNISLDQLAQVRAECPSIPIVVMANLDDTVVALKAVREGAQEYLLKGQTSSTLLVRTIRYAIERKRAEEALRYRLEFEELIATISTHFINISLDQMDRGINRALKAIGEFAGVDRSYLVRFDGDAVPAAYEWSRAGDTVPHQPRGNFSEREFAWIAEKLKQAETICLQRVQDLPPEAAATRHELELAEVRSLVCIPLIYGGSVVGCLGFESIRSEQHWSKDIISLLKIAGDMFVNALERKRTEWELQRIREMLLLYSRATNEVLWDWNLRTNEVWWNENLQRIYGHGVEKVDYSWWIEHIHPEDRAEIAAKIQNAFRSGRTFSALEYRFCCADGSYAKVLDRGYVVLDAQKNPIRMVGALMDISQKTSMTTPSDGAITQSL